MIKKNIILLLAVAFSMFAAGCEDGSKPHVVSSDSRINPKIIPYGKNAEKEADIKYFYFIDDNTGVVYLVSKGFYCYGITVMLNGDGLPVMKE